MAIAAALALVADLLEMETSSTSSEEDNDEDPSQPVRFTVHQISEEELLARTRLDQSAFDHVLNVIAPAIRRTTKRGRYKRLTPMHKLYVALQFYATGSCQWLLGSNENISQGTTSHAITEITDALVAVASDFICFPMAEEYAAVKEAFYALGVARHGLGFPDVLGLTDCTHVRIRVPNHSSEQYMNGNGHHSINMLLVVGPNLKIYNAVAKYPGSTDDSFIWENSAVRDGLAEGRFPKGWFIGDSGCPQEPWLMTPVANATTESEQLYNSVHSVTFNPFATANGVLKSRWHVLESPLAYTPEKVCSIAIACCVLHNICIEHNLDVGDLQKHPLPDDTPFQGPQSSNYDRIKTKLIKTHFTR